MGAAGTRGSNGTDLRVGLLRFRLSSSDSIFITLTELVDDGLHKDPAVNQNADVESGQWFSAVGTPVGFAFHQVPMSFNSCAAWLSNVRSAIAACAARAAASRRSGCSSAHRN